MIGLRSLNGFGSLVGPLVQSVLYSLSLLSGLALKLFRGVPAISGFDWLFTPTHSSSHGFSTPLGAGLQQVLPHLHPGHG